MNKCILQSHVKLNWLNAKHFFKTQAKCKKKWLVDKICGEKNIFNTLMMTQDDEAEHVVICIMKLFLLYMYFIDIAM